MFLASWLIHYKRNREFHKYFSHWPRATRILADENLELLLKANEQLDLLLLVLLPSLLHLYYIVFPLIFPWIMHTGYKYVSRGNANSGVS